MSNFLTDTHSSWDSPILENFILFRMNHVVVVKEVASAAEQAEGIHVTALWPTP